MISDCDQRTANLIRKKVYDDLLRMEGSVFWLELLKIRHVGEEVHVQGVFQRGPYEQDIPFVMKMPRVDGPLDHFLA